MRINVTQVLNDLEGQPLISNPQETPDKHKPWTVGTIMINCALGAPAQNQSYTPEQQIERYQLALEVQNLLSARRDGLEDDQFINVTAEMAARLKLDVARSFAPIVGGQVLPLFDGR